MLAILEDAGANEKNDLERVPVGHVERKSTGNKRRQRDVGNTEHKCDFVDQLDALRSVQMPSNGFVAGLQSGASFRKHFAHRIGYTTESQIIFKVVKDLKHVVVQLHDVVRAVPTWFCIAQ